MSAKISKASQDQSRASNPDVSAFVSANAGSGKTHVLVNRVIRLMLNGTAPEKILCLTYTKAAAAEMSNRLYKRLAEWIPLNDDELIEKIHENTGHVKFEKKQLAQPRRLFAKALETPGGLKIQTIHAFCEQLLHRFPIEAGVTADFQVMDDRQGGELMARVKNSFFNDILAANNKQNTNLAEIVKYAAGQAGFDDLLQSLLNKRDEMRVIYEDLDATKLRLASALNVPVDITIADVYANAKQIIEPSAYTHARDILAARTTKTDKSQATLIDQILGLEAGPQVFSLLQTLFLTAKKQPKSDKSLCTPNCGKENPDVLALLQDGMASFISLYEKANCTTVLNASMALFEAGRAITQLYDAEKSRHGLNDYSDLISKVLTMFSSMESAAWVLYKLDGGLDHILVDEAQDTSPAQWEIIQFLADDFFTGAAVRPNLLRTIFAVGDRKQSIYSFQGAVPKSFDEKGTYFRNLIEQNGETFEPVNFDVSFRSSDVILKTVDDVFGQETAARGVDETVHEGVRDDAQGIIEVWPIIEKQPSEKLSIWAGQIDDETDQSTRLILSRKIAQKIRQWLDQKLVLTSKKRPIQPGDILILLRNRTQLMDGLVRALKLEDIPVAGVDRLELTSHIAIEDLTALARFCLLPQDDLNFAGLLKSSLLSRDDGSPLDDSDLLILTENLSDRCLWSQIQQFADAGKPYSNAVALLTKWRAHSQNLLPFEFFSSVLNTDNTSKKIFTRLGDEAGEPIDAFLLMAQEYEKTNVTTLQGFLSWLERGDSEIKREMEQQAGEVRIMTIHGAKGLEADIVIMPDTYDVPNTARMPSLVTVTENTQMWRLRSDFSTNLTEQLKQKYLLEAQEEHNRLLYVAMTRACERLYIGAAQTGKKLPENSWYNLISNVVCNDDNQYSDDVFGHVWRLGETPKNLIENSSDSSLVEVSKPPLPNWINQKPKWQKPTNKWLAPSSLSNLADEGFEFHLAPLTDTQENRFLRGNLIHKLLEYLPNVLNEKRQMAQAYLNKYGKTLSKKDRDDTLNEVMALIEDPHFQDIFSCDGLSEVPIVAKITLPINDSQKTENLEESYVLNGQIDRLLIDDKRVLILDYKTNRPPPKNVSQINPQYIRQLAMYEMAMRQIYPNHTIKTGLLWTHTATLMEVPQSQLIDAFSTKVDLGTLTKSI